MADVATYEVPGPQRWRLADAVAGPGTGEPLVLSAGGRLVELPPAAGEAVRRLLHDLAAGGEVYVIAADAELTTQQAGELLGVSRTYVARLVDTGKLAGYRVGTHRRLRASDVLAYKAERDRRLQAVDDIARADRAAGLSAW